MWIPLDSPSAVQELLTRFADFHDSCLREVSVATATYIDEAGAMYMPTGLDTSALLHFQGQGSRLPALELRCHGVLFLKLRPTPENTDSIIASGELALGENSCRFTATFMSPPLYGPANSATTTAPDAEGPSLVVEAASIEWRPLESSTGDTLRYRPTAE